MFRNHCMLVLALSLSMPMAFAQGVYRNVGPDGKVTYSDSPAETSKEVKISQPRPTPAPKSEQIAAASSTSGSASERSPRGAKQAMGRDDTSSATPAPQKADRALEGAVIGVLGIEDLVLRAQEICNSTMPSASGKFSAATAGWKQRNADIVRRARQELSTSFSGASRQLIESGPKLRNGSMLSPVVSAPSESRVKWCHRTLQEVNSGTMDVHNNPKLTGPLMTAQAR